MAQASNYREPLPTQSVQAAVIHPLPGGPDAEADLIRRCQEGDTEAFGPLVETYQERIYNVIVRMVGNREEARDLAQDTFIKAFRAMANFRREAKFYTWLCRIAINTATSAKRKVAVRGKPDSIHGVDHDGRNWRERASQGPGPAEEVGLREQQGQVREAIMELNETFRVVVVLKDLEGRPYDEIAEMLSLPVGTIKSRLHRARMELKEKLRGYCDV